jgi:hypothetical protein
MLGLTIDRGTCCKCGCYSTPLVELNCCCRFCHKCLKKLFERLVKGRFKPPQCCWRGFIPLKLVEKAFDLEFKKMWNRKVLKFSTYNLCVRCPNRLCDWWMIPNCIPKDNIWSRAKCPYCGTRVVGSSQIVQVQTFKLK